jgi:hypothetical protein
MTKSSTRLFVGKILYSTKEAVDYFIYPTENYLIYCRERVTQDLYRWAVISDIHAFACIISPFSYPEFRNKLNQYLSYLKKQFSKGQLNTYNITSADVANLALTHANKYCQVAKPSNVTPLSEIDKLRKCISSIYTDFSFQLYKKERMEPEKEAYIRLQTLVIHMLNFNIVLMKRLTK